MTEEDTLASDFVPQCSDPVSEFADRGSADAIAGILEGEGVHTTVEARGLLAGIPAVYRVLVDPRQLHRARWVLREGDFTDGELSYLATGKLGQEPNEQPSRKSSEVRADPFPMSRTRLTISLLVPVLLWAAVSYAALPFIVAESEGNARIALIVLWMVGSFLYLLSLRSVARALRRNRRGSSREA